jgi:hypothetical protein
VGVQSCELMRDRLGAGEGVGYHAAEQIVLHHYQPPAGPKPLAASRAAPL